MIGWFASLVAIGVLGLAYMVLWPVTYTSEWTLILPSGTSGSNVSLSNIGQASSTTSSTLSDQTSMSPKVIYKSIAESDALREAAATRMGLTMSEFGKPKIKLIEQTALMLFSVNGATPDVALAKAKTLNAAFDDQLKKLRRDEIETRSQSVEASLDDYSATLKAARQAVLDFQQSSGLVSVAQFQELSSTTEQFRRKLAEARADVAELAARLDMLSRNLGLDSLQAAQAIAVASNTTFVKLLRDHAEAKSQFTDKNSRLGPNHPTIVREAAHLRDIEDAIEAHLRTVGAPDQAYQLESIIDTPARADLFEVLVKDNATLSGRQKQVQEYEAELHRAERDVERRTPEAVRLDDLQKRLLVAEAVYSSAVARANTNRADIYASYPLVQMLSAPTLPDDPSQPRLLFAALGGVLGAMMATVAWFLTWLHQNYALKRQKSY